MLMAIDPGTEQSAVVWFAPQEGYCGGIISATMLPNKEVLDRIAEHAFTPSPPPGQRLAIEMVTSYGMPVGREVFETVRWIGRFEQVWETYRAAYESQPIELCTRSQVRGYLCRDMKAKDANVRAALLERFGPPGNKKEPGRTYGITKDLWSALAIAVTVSEQGGRYGK